MGEAVPGAFAIDAHAAYRVNGDIAILFAAMLAAARGNVRLSTVTMAGMRSASFVYVICLRHFPPHAALEMYTLGGYMRQMRKEIKTSCLKRLKRIEGQIRGLAGMVEADRYCIDVVTQIAAAKAALRRVEEEILRDHVAHCVEHAIVSGDKADQRRKIAELMDVVGRAER